MLMFWPLQFEASLMKCFILYKSWVPDFAILHEACLHTSGIMEECSSCSCKHEWEAAWHHGATQATRLQIAPVARGASSGIHHMGTIPQTGAPICGAVRAGSKVDGDGQAAPLQPLGPTPRLVDGVCSRPCQSDSWSRIHRPCTTLQSGWFSTYSAGECAPQGQVLDWCHLGWSRRGEGALPRVCLTVHHGFNGDS